jgi:hypothetical protein
MPVGSFRQASVGNPANPALKICQSYAFWRFSAIGTAFELYLASAPNEIGTGEKGDFQMSGQSKLNRTLVAAAAALLMSTVTVGAAVGPAQAVAAPAQGTLIA